MENQNQRDEELWRIAKKRSAFKASLVTYCIINLALIAVWYFNSGPSRYFWPKWVLLWWGVAIGLQYFYAYHGHDAFSADREYQKLKSRNQN